MKHGLLSIFSEEDVKSALIDYLNYSLFDVLIEIDVSNDHFKFIYNVTSKYHTPVTEGSYCNFYSYNVDHLIHPDHVAEYAASMKPEGLADKLSHSSLPGTFEMQFKCHNISGEWSWVDQVLVTGKEYGIPEGKIWCYVYDIQNIMEREEGKTRVLHDKEIKKDTLTGLLKDSDFYTAAEALLKDQSVNWMMVVIDIEQLKLFNEWYGMEAGDFVLARIGSGLDKDAGLYNGLAGYMGNDDFCLMVPKGSLDVQELFTSVHNVIIRYGVSIGFLPAFGVSYSEGCTSVRSLFDQADLACHMAKEDFKHRIRYFDNSMYEKTADEYQLLSDFQKALKNHEISFYLQPQCRASTGKIVGAESLARWIKPDGTRIPPADFVPILEKYGFIPDLDQFIWEEVCKWSRSCINRGLPAVPVSVNVSQVDIFTLDVPAFFNNLVRKYNLPKMTVKVEITESACGEDSEKVRRTVEELRTIGFTVLMDDFGSGYSSLNMLNELNIDIIKLDAGFLRLGKTAAEKGIHILESVVNMAKTLELPIIVEGIETKEQSDYLMSLGCRYIQGYHFYKPMSREDFEKLIMDPEKIDTTGFSYKHNEEFHTWEFVNSTVYSDSMLNAILGPAALYSWHEDQVDIIRFNQLFYDAVNLKEFHDRLKGIQQYMFKADAETLFDTLSRAKNDRLNGASSLMSFLNPDGGFSRFLIHFYFLGEGVEGKRFFGSARNVTEITNMQDHMNLISRFSSDSIIFLLRRKDKISFEVAAHGLEDEMGISKDQLEAELNSGSFYSRILPEDRMRLGKLSMDSLKMEKGFSTSFTMLDSHDRRIRYNIQSDYVNDETSDVKGILSIRKEAPESAPEAVEQDQLIKKHI